MNDLLIQNAHIAQSTGVLLGDVLVQDGVITKIGNRIAAPGEDIRVIDATGKYLLPGGVDVHTHFDLDVGFDRASDNFYTGSVAAAHGGTTTIVDHMAFGPAGCRLTRQSLVYRELALPCVIDYGFHGVIQHVNDEVLDDMKLLRDEEGITSFKIYLTYDFRLTDPDVLKVLNRAKELGVVICAHCEDDAVVNLMRKKFVEEGNVTPRFHPLSRPPETEEEAVYRFMMLARQAKEPNVYVVHLSTKMGLDAVHTARTDGQKNLYVETCPQYLLLDDHLYDDDVEGLKYIMAPPLRKTTDNEALWAGLVSGDIDTVGTDHCPFFFATQKQRGAQNFTLAPSGMPGVELRMALLFSEGFRKRHMPLEQIVKICCTRPAKIFGISPQKGDIQLGADGDLVLFDPDIEWAVTKDRLHENVDYTPYEGVVVRGMPILTVSRGEVIVENGEFKGAEGRGQYLKRKLLKKAAAKK